MKMKSRQISMSNHSTVFGVGIGIVTAFIISFLLLAGLTSILVSGGLGEGMTGPLVFSIRTISLIVGVLVGTGFVKGKCIIYAGAITLGYMVLLAGLGIVIYDGSFENFGLSIISMVLGGVFGCLIRLKLQNKPQRMKKFKS